MVLSATNADEAMLVLEGYFEVNVLFTDIEDFEMPGSIDGLVLAGAARRKRPRIKVVVLVRVIDSTAPRLVA